MPCWCLATGGESTDLTAEADEPLQSPLATIAAGLLALAITAAVPVWLSRFDSTDAVVTFGNFRWLPLGAGLAAVGGLLFRYAPPNRSDGWRSVVPGVVLATAIWTAASIGYSAYVSSFSRYGEMYGTRRGAVVLLLWSRYTSLATLLGAELDEVLVIHGRARLDG